MSTAADAIRTAARIYRDASMTERVAAKCRLVVEFDPAADAIVYPLRWMLATGRASTPMVSAIDALKPAAFSKIFARVSREADGRGVREIAEAWTSALALAAAEVTA